MSIAVPTQAEPWAFGRPVRGYHWGAEHPRAALLLQHGYAEYAERHAEEYGRLIPRLVERGVSVFAFDMVGHGGSPGPRGVVDVAREADNHVAARRHLSEAGLPVFLLGHSLGGLVTVASVLEQPEGVAGVILSSPALLSPSNRVTRAALTILASVGPALGLVAQQDGAGLSRIEEKVARFKRDPRIYHGRVTTRLAASALAMSHANRGRYPDWTVPVLVLHGDDDRFTNPAGSTEFVDRIAAADRTLIMVPGGRHELLNDLDRDQVMARIVGWIEDRLPKN